MNKKRASILISFEKLARILNLQPGIDVTGATVDLETETVELFIKGEMLPECRRREAAFRIPLVQLMDTDQ